MKPTLIKINWIEHTHYEQFIMAETDADWSELVSPENSNVKYTTLELEDSIILGDAEPELESYEDY